MQNSPDKFPDNSLDWRFLLPISSESKILIIGHDCGHIQQYFINLGLSEVFYCIGNQPRSSNLGENETQQNILTYDDLRVTSQLYSFFDVVVCPSGLPTGSIEVLETFDFIKKFIRPDGVLFVGFSNGIFSKKTNSYYSHPWRIKKMLKNTGYLLAGIYGAIPDQYVPEYVFPLTPRAIGFVIRHRYTYKVPNMLLRLLTSPVATTMLVNFFPAYFVMATVNI